jgi:hypothetical protein
MGDDKPKGRINVDSNGNIVGTGGAAATLYGDDSTPIEVRDLDNNVIGRTTLGEVREKLGVKRDNDD